MHTAKRIDVASTDFSLDLMEERIKTDMEPLHSQISAVTQTMKKLIWDNSARTNPTTGPRDRRVQSECPLTDGPGTFKTLSLTSIVTAEYSPDSMGWLNIRRNVLNRFYSEHHFRIIDYPSLLMVCRFCFL